MDTYAGKRIYVIYTGGTLGSVPSGRDGSLQPGLSAEEVMNEFYRQAPDFKELGIGATLATTRPVDSAKIRHRARRQILRHLLHAKKEGYDGAFIIHGTDQLANTAAWLTFHYPFPDFPVALSGSYNSILKKGSAAIPNMYGSFLTAASDLSGYLIYFDGHVLRGAASVKVGDERHSFVSPSRPIIAERKDNTLEYTAEGAVSNERYNRRAKEWTERLGSGFCYLPPVYVDDMVRDMVSIETLTSDKSPSDFEANLRKYQAVVIGGWGTGNFSDERAMLNVVRKNSDEKIIVLGSMIPDARTDPAGYNTAAAAVRAGMMPSFGMPVHTAVEKLKFLMGLVYHPDYSDRERRLLGFNAHLSRRLFYYDFGGELSTDTEAARSYLELNDFSLDSYDETDEKAEEDVVERALRFYSEAPKKIRRTHREREKTQDVRTSVSANLQELTRRVELGEYTPDRLAEIDLFASDMLRYGMGREESASKGTVLIADNDEVVRRVMSMILEDEGYKCIGVSDPDEAIREFDIRDPDLVLSDVYMESTNTPSYRLLDHVKRERPGTHVIVVTGYYHDEKKTAKQKGADSVLPKPFEVNEFLDAVESSIKALKK